MTTYFTSDHHFGHANIITYAGRPFMNTQDMNETMVAKWNDTVTDDDVVYHLGDFAMGSINETLKFVEKLNGTKHLIMGNHDRCFPYHRRAKPPMVAKWLQRYKDAGFETVTEAGMFTLPSGQMVLLSHFPYVGDSHDGDRFDAARLGDHGVPLLHGHTHKSDQRISRSPKGTLQVHVGVDAWKFAPVSDHVIQNYVEKGMEVMAQYDATLARRG